LVDFDARWFSRSAFVLVGNLSGRHFIGEGRRQKTEDRRQKTEGRRKKAEGRRQKAEGRMFKEMFRF